MSFYNNYHGGVLGCNYGCGHSGYGYALCYERSWFSGCF
uniref:Keratin associated protein 22-1 n=1 Tax=Aotus nancymaae TaxID=37293 RepID=A0A2K5F8M9_AOTNA